MLCGMYKNAEQAQLILILYQDGRKDLSEFEREFIVGARTAGASVTKTAQVARVSIATVTEVTAAFRSSTGLELVVGSAHLMSVMHRYDV